VSTTAFSWSTRNLVGQFGLEAITQAAWGTRDTPSWDGRWNVGVFLNDHAVWLEGRQNTVSKVDVTTTINVPSTSTYVWKAQGDDGGVFYIDGNVVTTTAGWVVFHSAQIALTVGQHTLRIVSENGQGADLGGQAGVAFSVSSLCMLGYSGPDGGNCTACVTGKYKASAGSVLCSDCPTNSTSPPGSTSLTHCTSQQVVPACLAGVVRKRFTVCPNRAGFGNHCQGIRL
jgi:hypothetical protein